MYFIEALHDGTPWFLLAVFALLVTVAMNEAGVGSGITHHPFLTGSADAPEIPRATLFQQLTLGHERHAPHAHREQRTR